MSSEEHKDFSVPEGLAPTREDLFKKLGGPLARAQDPSLLEGIMENIRETVKQDDKVTFAVFFCSLSAYTGDSINLFVFGPSSTGKTYGTLETCQLFPEEDIMNIGAASPKFLIRQHGIQVNADGTPFTDERPDKPRRSDYSNVENYKEALSTFKDEMKQYADKLRATYTLIDLSGKILIFLESPNMELFNILRPILSHDKREMRFPYVDKDSKGHIRTVNVTVRGWPACIFLNARDQYVEELATRSFTVSPFESTDKYKAANEITNQFANFPWEKGKIDENRQEFRALIEYLKTEIKEKNYILPFKLSSLYPSQLPRDMRDFKHLLQLIQCITALHAKQRPTLVNEGKEFLVSSDVDVELAFDKFKEIFETTRTGLSEHVLKFYHKIVRNMPIEGPREEESEEESGQEKLAPGSLGEPEKQRPWRTGELVKQYNITFSPKRSRRTILRYLELLEEVGYVSSGEDSDDKRSFTWTALAQQNEENRANSDIQRMTDDLKLNLAESFKTWLGKLRHDARFYLEKKNGEPQWLPQAEVEKIILSQKGPACHNLVKPESDLNSELDPERTANEQTAQNAQSSAKDPLSLGEMLDLLHSALPMGTAFLEEQFLACVSAHGWTRGQHDEFFRKLQDQEMVKRTAEGLWMWA